MTATWRYTIKDLLTIDPVISTEEVEPRTEELMKELPHLTRAECHQLACHIIKLERTLGLDEKVSG
jgi:hypothetical protein